MKRSFLGLAILGILFILFGTGFALQGDGILGGSVMSGNPFWIYAGSAVAILGLIMAALGFYLGSRKQSAKASKMDSGKATTNSSSKDSPQSSKP